MPKFDFLLETEFLLTHGTKVTSANCLLFVHLIQVQTNKFHIFIFEFSDTFKVESALLKLSLDLF